MRQNLERALAARRESRRVAFRERFDPDSGLVKDMVAMANSGGGAILVPGDTQIDRQLLAQRLKPFDEFQIIDAVKDSQPIVAILIDEAPTPIVLDGIVYVRRGSKSEPATTEDLATALDRRVNATKRTWLNAVRQVVRSPLPSLASEVRDSDAPDATPIRVVDDPRAPAYRVVDYDKTHPYRQKELMARFRQRVPERSINQFDLLAVRHIHRIDDHPEFAHKSLFGTRQYSEKFLEWLVERAREDPQFFESARNEFTRRRTETANTALK